MTDQGSIESYLLKLLENGDAEEFIRIIDKYSSMKEFLKALDIALDKVLSEIDQ